MSHWSPDSPFHNIAHRGASAHAPDNTLEAIELAARHSATDVELDLNCTRDGQFVIRHDGIIANHYISELSFDDYQHICQKQSEVCLDLNQAIETAGTCGLGIYLDIKQVLPGQLPKLIELVRAANYQQKVVMASFRTDIIKDLKQIDPKILTSALFHSRRLDINSLVQGVGCNFLHPCFDIFDQPLRYFNQEFVDRVRASGAGLIAWNITDSELATVVVNMGVDGACADDPRILAEALAQRV